MKSECVVEFLEIWRKVFWEEASLGPQRLFSLTGAPALDSWLLVLAWQLSSHVAFMKLLDYVDSWLTHLKQR